jgi:hypothetical protein
MASKKRYGDLAAKKVERAMHEMKRGELKSGRSGRTVKSRKQAIAIGLSEARRAGGKVPPDPDAKAKKKSTSRKRRKTTTAAKRTASRKRATTGRKRAGTSRKRATSRRKRSR